mmetsp:Transcript_13972/g.20921  ORF Transcript_13972/g.20921 Transcript_13972/m.20921 type:complete len:227 (+) Transcript_13972:206-886(+)
MASIITMSGVETSLLTTSQPQPQPQFPLVATTNESSRRNRRFQKFRSFFSCLLPRSSVHQNRWKNTCEIDSKCKGLTRNLIIKEIGKDGTTVDDTGESLDLSSSEVNRKIISSNFTKTRMNSDDSFSSDSQSISCEKCTKIGIHPIQTPSKETDEECCKTSRRSSRRIIDCSQDCPICWDSFKLGEQVCWSKNVSCRHGFHLDCMLVWLKDHAQCPLCRCDYMRKR